MKLSEFKNWIAGFLDAIEDKPTGKQWETIKGKILEIESDVNIVEKIIVQERTQFIPVTPITNPIYPNPATYPFPGQIICSETTVPTSGGVGAPCGLGSRSVTLTSNINGAVGHVLN